MMWTREPSADSPVLNTMRFNMCAVVATRSRAGVEVEAICCAVAGEHGASAVAMKASTNRAAAYVALFVMAVRAMDCRRGVSRYLDFVLLAGCTLATTRRGFAPSLFAAAC